jgi:hypothetical protein
MLQNATSIAHLTGLYQDPVNALTLVTEIYQFGRYFRSCLSTHTDGHKQLNYKSS